MQIHDCIRITKRVVSMRDERRKEERSKQGQTNNKAKKHSIHVRIG